LEQSHQQVEISAAEFWRELPRALWHQDEPVADPASDSLYFAAGLAAVRSRQCYREKERTKYSADTRSTGNQRRSPRCNACPVLLKRFFARPPLSSPRGERQKLSLAGHNSLEKRYYGNAFIFSETEKEALLNPELYPAGWTPPWEVTAPYYRKSAGADATTRMQHLDFYTWLPGDILAKADRMSSAHSLELRLPYLDHILVEFAATIPPRFKIVRGMTKYILRNGLGALSSRRGLSPPPSSLSRAPGLLDPGALPRSIT